MSLRPGCAVGLCEVLADAGYGLSAPFRQGLTARKLAWAVGIPRHLKVYPAAVRMIFPLAKRGRPRQRHVPDILSMPAEDMLANATWRTISWRTGTKGKLKARFAAVRVRIADGAPQRIRDKLTQIACTDVGCLPVPGGCFPTGGKTFDGLPTGFDVTVCPDGVRYGHL